MFNRNDEGSNARGTGDISLNESMAQCLAYFESAVLASSKSPREIYEEFGEHLGVSWELRQELLSGKPLLGWSTLSDEMQERLKAIIDLVEGMPEEAFGGSGLQDLLDPSWDLVRKTAFGFLKFSQQRGTQ